MSSFGHLGKVALPSMVAFCNVAGTAASSSTLAPSALPGAISKARAIVQSEVASKVPGMSVAVAIDGQLVWSESFGWADLEAKKPATPATRFRIGSVSKPLTSAGLMLLVEKGKIDLDAKVQRYVPDFPEKSGPLSLRLLGGHLSGIRNYRGTEAVSNRAYPSLRAGLKIFENDPLEFSPGERFAYSSFNWNLIGAAMEAVTQEEFTRYMNAAVIEPLGLTNTVPDRAGAADALRARFYEVGAHGEFVAAPPVDFSFVWPAGGYLSTAEDLVRFGSAMLKPGLIRAESLEVLFTSQKTSSGKLSGYGLGWFVRPGLVFHGGDSVGGTAMLLMAPGTRTVVAFATNGGQGLLRNAIRKGRATKDAEQFLFNKEAVAVKLAKSFNP